jgi:hypothetical protein
VHLEQGAQGILRRLRERAVDEVARVQDDGIEAAEPIERRRDGGVARGAVGGVGGDEGGTGGRRGPRRVR